MSYSAAFAAAEAALPPASLPVSFRQKRGLARRITDREKHMFRKSILALLAGAAFIAIPSAMAQRRDDALQMISVDVEGGGGTVFVTPGKKVVVIDTGNPDTSAATGSYPSAQRIVD